MIPNWFYNLINGPDEIDIDNLIKVPLVRYALPDHSKLRVSNGDARRDKVVMTKCNEQPMYRSLE